MQVSLCRHHILVVSFFSEVHSAVVISPGSWPTAVVTENVSLVKWLWGGGAENIQSGK